MYNFLLSVRPRYVQNLKVDATQRLGPVPCSENRQSSTSTAEVETRRRSGHRRGLNLAKLGPEGDYRKGGNRLPFSGRPV